MTITAELRRMAALLVILPALGVGAELKAGMGD